MRGKVSLHGIVKSANQMLSAPFSIVAEATLQTVTGITISDEIGKATMTIDPATTIIVGSEGRVPFDTANSFPGCESTFVTLAGGKIENEAFTALDEDDPTLTEIMEAASEVFPDYAKVHAEYKDGKLMSVRVMSLKGQWGYMERQFNTMFEITTHNRKQPNELEIEANDPDLLNIFRKEFSEKIG